MAEETIHARAERLLAGPLSVPGYQSTESAPTVHDAQQLVRDLLQALTEAEARATTAEQERAQWQMSRDFTDAENVQLEREKAALESQLRSLQDQQDRLKTDSGLVWMLLLRGDLAMPQAVKDLQDQQETLRQERASLAARPELEKAWADLFDLNHVATTDERSAAFLRIYASQLRQRHPWDIAETMASTIENIATHVEQRAADPAPSAPPVAPDYTKETIVQFRIKPPIDMDRWKALVVAAVEAGAVHVHVNPPPDAPPRPEGWQETSVSWTYCPVCGQRLEYCDCVAPPPVVPPTQNDDVT